MSRLDAGKDLALLLTHVAELGLPVEVRPSITRSDDGSLTSADVTVHVHVGRLPPDPAIDTLRLDDSLEGQWFRVTNRTDVELAGTLRADQSWWRLRRPWQ